LVGALLRCRHEAFQSLAGHRMLFLLSGNVYARGPAQGDHVRIADRVINRGAVTPALEDPSPVHQVQVARDVGLARPDPFDDVRQGDDEAAPRHERDQSAQKNAPRRSGARGVGSSQGRSAPTHSTGGTRLVSGSRLAPALRWVNRGCPAADCAGPGAAQQAQRGPRTGPQGEVRMLAARFRKIDDVTQQLVFAVDVRNPGLDFKDQLGRKTSLPHSRRHDGHRV